MKANRILTLLLCVLSLTCCKYDDSELWKHVNDMENRIAALENLCKEMNTNINALNVIVRALQDRDYITSVNSIFKDGQTIGYTVSFAKSSPITIYNGTDGKDGINGKDGKDGSTPKLKIEEGYWYISMDNGTTWSQLGRATGENGKDGTAPLLKIEEGYWYISTDNGVTWSMLAKATGESGKDGSTPNIGIAKDTDGQYYWTCNGTWLLDSDGNKIRTTGNDGTDGRDGEDGKNGIGPKLKIENGYWYISTDNGVTWNQLGKATGENGKDGKDGKDASNIFSSVTFDNEYVYFYLFDGTMLKIPLSFYHADTIEYDLNGHKYVDLGLPSGTMWATMNIGAENKEERGDFFAWGETSPKEKYESSNYKFKDNSKYNSNDGLLVLENSDDAAYTLWGENWSIPTKEQVEELISKCDMFKYENDYYNKGFILRGPNAQVIYFPISGYSYGYYPQETGLSDYGDFPLYYWTNTDSYYFPNGYGWYKYNRATGMRIRPVCKKE